MATPHVTGSAALMRAVHPDWTVTEVKSALMMTATNTNGVEEDGVTPWTIDDVGSGRVDLTKAALAGLTMDETYANFVAADPAATPPGDVKKLNLPLLRNMTCNPNCNMDAYGEESSIRVRAPGRSRQRPIQASLLPQRLAPSPWLLEQRR